MPATGEAMTGPVSRRAVLKGLAAAGLAGCGDQPVRQSTPYADQPEGIAPGLPDWYATAIEFQGYAQPVLAASHMGRPTKLEGNPDSAWARGATDAFTQAACAVLYDPQRSLKVRPGGWAAFAAAVGGLPGRGLRILTGTVTSPTLARQLAALTAAGARWHVHEPVGSEASMRASRLAFGRVLDTHLRLDRCRAVVSVDDDLLGPGPDQVRRVRGWSEARRSRPAPRLLVAEPTLSLTGAAAADRIAVAARRLPPMVAAMAAEMGFGRRPRGLTEAEAAWAAAAAMMLAGNPGRAALTVGSTLPAETIALAHALNQAAGNFGRTVVHTEPVALVPPDGEDSFRALVGDMAAGRVEAVMILDCNPVHTRFADLDFAAALARVPLKIHAGLFDDETAASCDWHVPMAHALEDWTDLRAPDGTATIVQPLIEPVFGAHRRHEILAALLGEPAADARLILMDTWRAFLGEPFEPLWRRALHEGVVAGTGAREERVRAAARTLPAPPAAAGLELVFRPDPHAWDGRFAPIAWLQELPHPLTKLTWDNVAGLSASLAGRLGVVDGDMVEITAGGRSITAPAWVLPGQAEDTVTLTLGHGRNRAALPGTGGYDAYALRPADSPWALGGATLRRTGARVPLATTQPHRHLSGHEDLIRTVRPGLGVPPQPEPASLHPDWDYPGFAWGMVVDLDLCTGCNACVVACQAENNIPVVGKSEVARGREMHWLRVDVYHQEAEDGRLLTHFAPIPCMHCEKAPCEVGCPVNATVHGPDGLNQMVYSRCIGTRTCSSYCPYKVRRFNFFDYPAVQPATHRLLRNPDVTVRSRGVMEKCTYCVQRIRRAQIEARRDGRPLADGAVTTACAQACPAQAIVFGDLNAPHSRVAALRHGPRHYAMLHHLGTRPRTTYLAKVREP